MLYIAHALITLRHKLEDADRERGATAVEYGIMVALIAVVIIVAVGAIGTRLTGVFEDVRDALPI